MAQRGFDTFEVPRTVVILPPTNLVASATVSNVVCDVGVLDGNAKIDIAVSTNVGTATGTLTVQLYMSKDYTNWVAATNLAYLNSTNSNKITNSYYNFGASTTNGLVATNISFLPGTWTTPNPATAGFATPYLSPPPYTNGLALTVTGNGVYEIGFQINDSSRYLQLVVTATGQQTNDDVTAFLTAMPKTYSLRAP